MADLLEGDAVTQAETFQSVDNDAVTAPNTTNRLKLAIALSIPGHPGSNAEHAQRELRELLAASEVLLPEERILATLQLAQVEQSLLLDLEAQQTQTAAVESIQRQNTDAEQRLRQVQEENRALRQQLEEAQNVIDELTDIERSIRERESANQR
jgi:predicted RNase H-like nuclease (RuvC/YqgF family)